MNNLFEYPEDRGEIFGEPNEEEAHLHFTINDFEELILKYGVEFVMTKIRLPIYRKLYEYFEDL